MSRMNTSRQGGQRFGQKPNRSGGQPPLAPAAPGKLYKDPGKAEINPDLLDSVAWDQAGKMHGRLNSSQLRRFYGEVKGLHNRLVHQEPFERLLPMIKMIKSKVYYGYGRKNNSLPKEFAEFLLGGIDQIQDQKDFEAIALYFEAVVGFMYGKGLVTK